MPKGKKRHKKRSGGVPHRSTKRTALEGLSSMSNLPNIVPFGVVVEDDTVAAIEISGDPDIPDGTYTFVDAYCSDPQCDCRVVYLMVMTDQGKGPIAYISLGWEPLSFYQRWMKAPSLPGASPVELKGPSLMPLMPQSRLAEPLLKVVRFYVQDKDPVEFFKARYFALKAQLSHRS